MVLQQHHNNWNEIFELKGFFAEPFMMFGFQEMTSKQYPQIGQTNFKEYLSTKGVIDCTIIDWNDTRADIHFDMNMPWPTQWDRRYKVFADIGCLEHVLNTYQCLKNSLSLVDINGLYLLHTPVSGYFKHGLHTFNPEMIRWILRENGFFIVYDKLSTKSGAPIKENEIIGGDDVLLWIVARKVREVEEFIIPIDNHGSFFHRKEQPKEMVV